MILQIINAVEEFLFPVGVKKTKELIEKRKLSRSIGGGGDGGGGVGGGEAKVGGMHSDEDQDYIKRAVEEMQRPEFDVAVEYSEMIVQYGYVMLFSVIWPFAPICCLVNNFLELRSDALKIAITTR